MNLVYDQAFGAKTPTYSTVLQLDRKLRGFAVPSSLQIAGFGNSESRGGNYYESVPLILQRHLVLAIRESSAYSHHPSLPLLTSPLQICSTCIAAFLLELSVIIPRIL